MLAPWQAAPPRSRLKPRSRARRAASEPQPFVPGKHQTSHSAFAQFASVQHQGHLTRHRQPRPDVSVRLSGDAVCHACRAGVVVRAGVQCQADSGRCGLDIQHSSSNRARGNQASRHGSQRPVRGPGPRCSGRAMEQRQVARLHRVGKQLGGPGNVSHHLGGMLHQRAWVKSG